MAMTMAINVLAFDIHYKKGYLQKVTKLHVYIKPEQNKVDMETIVFDRRNNVAGNELPCSIWEERQRSLKDIITIDSQIELKVCGDLPELKILNGATEFMEQKMASFLGHRYDGFRLPVHKVTEGVLNFDDAKSYNSALEHIKRIHWEKTRTIAERDTNAARNNKFLFSVEPGFEIIIPPYDREWANSFASFSSANKVSGSIKSFSPDNENGASGVGIFLSPTTDISAKFNAHCPVSYSWSNFVNEGGGYAASQGGLGFTLYNATCGTLVTDDLAILWNQSRRPSDLEISGGSDDIYLRNTSIGHRYVEMKGGETYLAWLWCWVFTDCGPNAAAYANIDCKVPFMIIDSSMR
jgi:hypothetical protein